MSDLAETIAWGRGAVKTCMERGGVAAITADDLTTLLDAAEAGMRARDAALEETAALVDHALYPRLAAAIRALKGAA